MRVVFLVLCLIVAVPVQAATWYVRPRTGEYGEEDGKTHATAWDGVSAIVWGPNGVEAGDTLFVCGTFIRSEEAVANVIIEVGASGTEGNHITIRGDYPGDSGRLIAAHSITSWTDANDGVFRTTWTSSTDCQEAFELDPGTGTEQVLKPVSSLQEVIDTEGSQWHDNPNDVFWYNPSGATPQTVYTRWVGCIATRAHSYITIKNLTCYCGGTAWPIIEFNNGHDLVVDGCTLRYAATDCISNYRPRHNYTITNNTMEEYTVGVYMNRNKISDSDANYASPHDVVISNNYFDCGDSGYGQYWAPYREPLDQDRGAIALQPGDNYTIADNHIARAVDYGILFWRSMEYDNTCNNIQILRNRIDGVWDEDSSCSSYGIAIAGGNGEDSGDRMLNLVIAHNTIEKCIRPNDGPTQEYGIGLRLRSGLYTDPNTRPRVIGNVIIGCDTNIRLDRQSTPAEQSALCYIMHNNISVSPTEGGWHCRIDYEYGRIVDLDMSNNCWYPDTSDGNNLFLWGKLPLHPNAEDFADFAAMAAARGVTIGVGSIVGDPRFNDLAAGDYTLRTDSPCIDTGSILGDTFSSGLSPETTWPSGVAVVDQNDYGSGWEMGAFVYTGPYPFVASSVNGTITISPDKSVFEHGETVILEAVADPNYAFVGWSGDLTGTTNPVEVVMDGHKSVLAHFGTYTLGLNALNGSVSSVPEKASYGPMETVTLTATADTGYSFISWSGDLTGSDNPVELVMDSDKTVTASFAVNTYGLTTRAANGSIVKSPETTAYEYGQTVTLEAIPNASYHFTGWSGDIAASNNPTTLLMDADKVVTANFAINTYTITANATNGSVVPTPDQTIYNHGDTVTVQAVPADGYAFSGWSGDLNSGNNPETLVVDSDKVITATFTYIPDNDAPTVTGLAPEADAIQIPANSLVTLHVTDETPGVDANTVTISVDGVTVYSGNVDSYSGGGGICRRTGTEADFAYAYQADSLFDFDEEVTVVVNASDLNGNAMTPYSYSFRTEMWAFGANHIASWGPQDLDKGHPATVCDSSGNIWVVYHAGPVGQRDVYLSRLTMGNPAFSTPMQLTDSSADHACPDIAIGPDDTLYVVWQDDRWGNWDIYGMTSADGVTWSAVTRLTESNDDQTASAIAADPQSPGVVHIAFEDDGAVNQDIYVASSSDSLATATIAQVTTETADQTTPDIAVDASGVVYVVWADERRGTADIYGASSDYGPWTNVALMMGAGNQTTPTLATEATGSVLHFAWADDSAGDSDIWYASSDPMPAVPATRTNVIDDTSGADQLAPTLITTGSTGDDLKVFLCWQDWRNVIGALDTDLYFVQVKTGDDTNVLVGDGSTGSNQNDPALGVDLYGYPYVVWTDERNGDDAIYHAGASYLDPEEEDTQVITAATGGTVGDTTPTTVGDVSVVIPAGACPHDVTISITEIANPIEVSDGVLLAYDFGPSGLEFSQAVTVTIPYLLADYPEGGPAPYWYDPQTGSPSQEGISSIEVLSVSDFVGVVRFQTTHFTTYGLLDAADTSDDTNGSSDGGGCALSPIGRGGILEFLLPYGVLAAVMVMIRLRDRRALRYAGGRAPHT